MFRWQNVIYRVNAEALLIEHEKQSRRKATGIDGIGKESYEINITERLENLIQRMKLFQYRPQPVRRTYIPKADGKLRPLGIPAYEDRLVQGVMTNILSEIYEDKFLDCSYGFRPGRSCHDVVRTINQTIMTKKVNFILEADIKGFFDNVNHEWLMTFLEHDIADKRFLRYIKRFLKSGIMEEGRYIESDRGTPQGGIISPILANVYLHYVIDLWFEKVVKPRLRGEAYYVRYADDFLIMFQYEDDANRVMEVLPKRLGKFSLEVAPDKTRILPFGRFRGTKESFDFLGFTFFNTVTLTKKYRLGVRTSKKKLQMKRQAAKKWLHSEIRQMPVPEIMKRIALVIKGHCNYYGVNGNLHAITAFWNYMKTSTYIMLTRRSQRHKWNWKKFNNLWNESIPFPHICVNIWQTSKTI
ncbi:MAG: group II intron reverse transcriptase/maturase [Oscillospiraceae bacterium]|nr:group II intron reverse transcriptase/maturase [Oscillospiraceae bacterium]